MAAGNPYDPPQSEVSGERPDAPAPFGWRVAGKVVWVRDVAQLPMIDPFNGRSEGVMELRRVLVRYEPRRLGLVALGCGLVGVVIPVFSGGLWVVPMMLGGGLGLIVGWIVHQVVSGLQPTCLLRLFFTKRALRQRVVVHGVLRGLLLGSILVFLFQRMLPQWMGLVAAVMFCGGISGSLVLMAATRRLRCRRRAGGWWEVSGFHRKALRKLAEGPACPAAIPGGGPGGFR